MSKTTAKPKAKTTRKPAVKKPAAKKTTPRTKAKAKPKTKALTKKQKEELAELNYIGSDQYYIDRFVGSDLLRSKKLEFLKAMTQTQGSIRESAQLTGISNLHHNDWIKHDDEYTLAIADIEALNNEDVEISIRKNVIGYKGAKVVRKNGKPVLKEDGTPYYEDHIIRGDAATGIKYLQAKRVRGYTDVQRNLNLNANVDLDKARKANDIADNITAEEVNELKKFINSRIINIDEDA